MVGVHPAAAVHNILESEETHALGIDIIVVFDSPAHMDNSTYIVAPGRTHIKNNRSEQSEVIALF